MNFKNSKFLLGSLMPSSFITTGFRVIGPQERKIRQTAYTRKDQFNVNCNSAIFERKFYKIEIPILPKVLEWAQIYPLKCQLEYHEKCCFPTTLLSMICLAITPVRERGGFKFKFRIIS